MASVQCDSVQGRYILLEVWEESVSEEDNSSVVGWKATALGDYAGSGTWKYTHDTRIVIDDVVVYDYEAPAWDPNAGANSKFPICKGTSVSGSLTVPHDSSGSKTVTFSLTTGILVLESTEYSWWLNLTDITTGPMAVTALDTVLGESCHVSFTPRRDDLYYKLRFEIGPAGKWYQTKMVFPATTGPYVYDKFAIPLTAARQIREGRTGTMTLTVSAHTASPDPNDDYLVGDKTVTQFQVTVPIVSSTRPTVTIETALVSTLPEKFKGLYIQGKTKVKATVKAAGKYRAAPRKLTLKADGVSYSGTYDAQMDGETDISDSLDITTRNITQSGTVTLSASVTDSRGISGTGSKSVTFLGYSKPKIRPAAGQNQVVAVRCTAEGLPADTGTYLKIQAKREWTKILSGGANINFCKIRYRFKADTDSTWSVWKTILEADAASDEADTGPMDLRLDPARSYDVQVQAVDDIGSTSETTISVSTKRVYCHRDGSRGAFAFGKMVEPGQENVFDIAEEKTVIIRGMLALGASARRVILDLCHPVGSVMETVGNVNPGTVMGGSWQAVSNSAGIYKWKRIEDEEVNENGE